VVDDLLRTDGPATSSTGTSEGYRPLREALAGAAEIAEFRSLPKTSDRHRLHTGIDLLAKLFLDKGDAVVVEDPTFLTALRLSASSRRDF
jgi:DNA-binding transcriptional MocR family regulator